MNKNDEGRTAADAKDRRSYEAPRLSVYTEEELLAGLGPARAAYTAGSGPGGLLP